MFSMISSLMGMTAGLVGSIMTGVQEKQMADYNAKVAANDAELHRRAAERARLVAENAAIAEEQNSQHQAELERKRMETVKAQNRAREGAGGFALTGTPLMLQLEMAENIEMNHLELLRQGNDRVAQIRYNGEMNAYGELSDEMFALARKKSYKQQGRNARARGIAGAIIGQSIGGAKIGSAIYDHYKKNDDTILTRPSGVSYSAGMTSDGIGGW